MTWTCQDCSRAFADARALRQHRRAAHPTPAQVARKARQKARDAAVPDTPPAWEEP